MDANTKPTDQQISIKAVDDPDSSTFPYVEVLGVASAIASLFLIVLLIYAVWRCRCRQPVENKMADQSGGRCLTTATSNWCSWESERESSVSFASLVSSARPAVQPDLCISQSVPDLQDRPTGDSDTLTDATKSSSLSRGSKQPAVKKQNTLPALSHRHLWFRRLLYFGARPTSRNETTGSPTKSNHPFSHSDSQLDQHERSTTLSAFSNPQLTNGTVNTGLVQPKAVGCSSHGTSSLAFSMSSRASLLRTGFVNGNCVKTTTRVVNGNENGGCASYGRLIVGLTYSELGGDYDVMPSGNVDSGLLIVHVIRAEGLPAKPFSGWSDPYVKIHMLPERTPWYQTKLKRKTLNPVYEEKFQFPISSLEALQSRFLHFSIYDFDRFSRHDLIGTAVMQPRLDPQDVAKERMFVLDIAGAKQSDTYLGEILLSLRYLPTAGRLTVSVLKARNLRATDVSNKSNPYVKVTLMCQEKRITKRKTSVQQSTFNPVFNEAMTFDVPHENIDDVSVVVKVIHEDSNGGREMMGAAAIGSQFNDEVGRDHWSKMLELPRKSVAQWYHLSDHVPSAIRSSLDSSSSTS